MKHTKIMAIVTLLLLAASVAAAQSLGDVARAARKNKAEQASTSHHFDNDNLPTSEGLSVVGPPSVDAKQTLTANDAAVASSSAAADRQKTADDWRKKIDDQKAKIDSLNKDLDLDQREYRLRAAANYSDAGNRLRNQGEWDQEDKRYRSEIDAKQKEIDAARQKLDDMQEQAHKAGIADKDKDNDK
jgi:hypothetical protein